MWKRGKKFVPFVLAQNRHIVSEWRIVGTEENLVRLWFGYEVRGNSRTVSHTNSARYTIVVHNEIGMFIGKLTAPSCNPIA